MCMSFKSCNVFQNRYLLNRSSHETLVLTLCTNIHVTNNSHVSIGLVMMKLCENGKLARLANWQTGKYTCTICGHCCHGRITLHRHMKVHKLNIQFNVDTHTGEQNCSCTNCKTQFSNGSTLQ